MTGTGWLLLAGSFVLGGVPFGYVLGRLRGVDVRHVGSGNIGATNVMRATGRVGGLLTFLLDGGKGAVAALAAPALGLGAGWASAAALAAVVGHCHSPFMGLRGGKGVATLVGGFAVLSPAVAGIGALGFAATLLAWGYVAVASQILALSLVVAGWLWHGAGDPRTVVALAGSALIAWRHRDNWRRLRAGTESRVLRGRRSAHG